MRRSAVLPAIELPRRLLHTAGFPRLHLVIAWNNVDLPTLASPTLQVIG